MDLFAHQFGTENPKTVVILHGLFGISDNWVTLGKQLAQQYRVIIPDLRNHGRSSHAPAMSYQIMAEDVALLIDRFNLKTTCLLGHSMGGKVAMQLALNQPELINRLVVVDIAPGPVTVKQVHLNIIKAMKSVDFDQLHNRSDIDQYLADSLPDNAVRLFVMKNLYRIAPGRFGWRCNLAAIETNIDHLMEGVQADSPFRNPTLFLKGGNSNYITEDDHTLIHELFPIHTLLTIPDTGHWLHAEQPKLLYQKVTDFL
jgi:esterase